MRIPAEFVASTGLHPGWRCNNCGLELREFPSKEKIKLDKKTKGVKVC